MAKFLFIRGGAVGDFILTMPALQLVRDHLPGVEIEVLGYPSIAKLAVAAGLADRVRSIEHSALAPFFAPGATLDREMVSYLASFDVVVSYLYDPDGFFRGNLERAGVETFVPGPYRMSEEEPRQAAAMQLARPLERFALYLEDPGPVFSFANATRVASTLPESVEGPVCALHPGSGSPAKNWSLESWITVAEELRRRESSLSFLFVSGEAESGRIERFLAMAEERSIPFRHLESLPLDELASAIATADFFLGHDSGISHLAAGVGLPGILLFGPTDPAVWAPPHEGMIPLVAPDGDLSRIRPGDLVDACELHFFTSQEKDREN